MSESYAPSDAGSSEPPADLDAPPPSSSVAAIAAAAERERIAREDAESLAARRGVELEEVGRRLEGARAEAASLEAQLGRKELEDGGPRARSTIRACVPPAKFKPQPPACGKGSLLSLRTSGGVQSGALCVCSRLAVDTGAACRCVQARAAGRGGAAARGGARLTASGGGGGAGRRGERTAGAGRPTG
eukprot:3059242-Prymnesium_polylepis.1